MARDHEKDFSDENIKQSNFFDSESYIIQLNFKREEFFNALDQFNDERAVTPVLRSFLHEHTHFLQYATTSVGYYLKLLRDFQLLQFTQIAQEALNIEKSIYPMMPLIFDIKSKSVRHQKPAHFYYYWVLAEIVRLMLIGDFKTLDYYLKRMMSGNGLIDYFMELEQYLNKMLSGKFQSNSRGLKTDDKVTLKKLLSSLYTNFFSGINITSAMESQALLSEYFFDETADEFLMRAIEKSSFKEDQIHYLLPLKLYQSAYSFDLREKSDFLSFKLGFSAICQITFNAPILPFQDKFGSYSLGDIEVNARFNELLLFVKAVSPPKSLDDYDRYINELLTERSYISLDNSYKGIRENREIIFNNRFNRLSGLYREKEQIFLSAQSKYDESKINYYRFMSGQSSSPEMYSIKYSDTKLSLPLSKIGYCLQDLIYQYYEELLYGYESKKSLDYIRVYPVVELSDVTMNLLQDSVRMFNNGLKIRSKLLPQMKLVKGK